MGWFNTMVGRLYELVRTAPTTNMRILLTLGMALGTAIKYWVTGGWVPAAEWLIFLTGMAGLDVLQHHNKRKTTFSPTEHAEAARIKNGHDSQSNDDEEGIG